MNVRKGLNWASISGKFAHEILHTDLKLYEGTYFSDEVYKQTIFINNDSLLHATGDEEDEGIQAARYSDWNRGSPYEFKYCDFASVVKLVNTKYAFIRKVDDTLSGALYEEVIERG